MLDCESLTWVTSDGSFVFYNLRIQAPSFIAGFKLPRPPVGSLQEVLQGLDDRRRLVAEELLTPTAAPCTSALPGRRFTIGSA